MTAGYWHQGKPLVGDDTEPHPLDADGVQPPPDTAWVRTARVGHDNYPPPWWDRMRRRLSATAKEQA